MNACIIIIVIIIIIVVVCSTTIPLLSFNNYENKEYFLMSQY
jgi:hypothetical protein